MRKGYKVKYDKKLKENKVAYYNVSDKEGFRKAYLSELIGNQQEVFIALNTNLMDQSVDVISYCREIEQFLSQANQAFRVFPVPNTREKKMFGIKVGTDKGKAFLVLAKVSGAFLLGAFFEAFIEKADIMIGIETDQSFETLVHDFQSGYEEHLYDVESFKFVIYDSILIESIRTNFPDFPDVSY